MQFSSRVPVRSRPESPPRILPMQRWRREKNGWGVTERTLFFGVQFFGVEQRISIFVGTCFLIAPTPNRKSPQKGHSGWSRGAPYLQRGGVSLELGGWQIETTLGIFGVAWWFNLFGPKTVCPMFSIVWLGTSKRVVLDGHCFEFKFLFWDPRGWVSDTVWSDVRWFDWRDSDR